MAVRKGFRLSPKFAVATGMALLALALSACGSSSVAQGTDAEPAQFLQVCRDKNTGNRVDDSKCEDVDEETNTYRSSSSGGSAFMWYWLGRHSAGQIPAVGQSTNNYSGFTSSSKPANGEVFKGGSSKGGSFSSATSGATSTKVGSAAGKGGSNGGFGGGGKSGSGSNGGSSGG